MPNAQCPMPNAQCPMPNAQCPMPNAQCPMPNAQFMFFLIILLSKLNLVRDRRI
ncbi:MAG: hypothetical protein KME31_09060 [Tolypothrix carrinoi HA7290-LM1]|nr:hypothetical protein [Tolypothrix carrinoi HA7290-LM1]